MAKKKGADINELKQEVQMDEHQIPMEELVKRLDSDIDNVSSFYVLAGIEISQQLSLNFHVF
ncbi:unnamed protein product [Brugia timori]|uniref:Carrier domain-containing protein n=1 Tax=Brugia timori TaxID=42155 RepID=A0A0R3R9Z7_9BILA|nr:unnamed protein product [Brugia timori]